MRHRPVVIAAIAVVAACGASESPEATTRAPQGSAPVFAPIVVQPPPPPPLPSTKPIVQLALGAEHTCALHDGGDISCWGNNEHYELGVHGPLAVTPIRSVSLRGVVQLAAGENHTCAVMTDGTAECWGSIDPKLAANDHPVPLVSPPIAQMSGSCVRTRDGDIRCIDGDKLVPIPGIAKATDLAAYRTSGCAVVDGGKVTCWSYPYPRDQLVVRAIPGIKNAVQVASGSDFGCARLADGHVSCWGVEYLGQLGRGVIRSTVPRPTMRYTAPTEFPPGPVANVSDAAAIVAGGQFACVLRTGGTVACWGSQPSGRYDRSHAWAGPTTIAGLTGITQIAVGTHACALGTGRDVWCWGTGSEGQLGNGWSRAQTTPVDVPGITDAVAVVDHCARRATGRIACWGFDQTLGEYRPPHDLAGEKIVVGGELATVDANGAVVILEGDRRVTEPVPLASHASQRCAVIRDGTVQCWSAPGAWIKDHKPKPVPGITDAIAVFDGMYQSCILRRSGAIACVFGTDTRDLGAVRTVPVIDDATAIAVSPNWEGVTCAIRKDRTVWCWRWNLDPYVHGGPVPVPPTAPSRAPEPTGITDATAIAVGYDHVCGVHSDGTVACFGDNDRGQLGDGTLVSRGKPTAIGGIADAVDIAAGYKHTCIARKSGAVACWGIAEHGAVGTYATRWMPTPLPVTW